MKWDQFGVPYVTGATYDDVMFGAGYAATRDRMFLMDALRHSGRARLAEFAGGTEGNLAMDRKQLASAYYTEEEAQAQIGEIAKRYGEEGEKLAQAVDAYIAGINAAQDEMCPGGLPAGQECPAEYAFLQKTPGAVDPGRRRLRRLARRRHLRQGRRPRGRQRDLAAAPGEALRHGEGHGALQRPAAQERRGRPDQLEHPGAVRRRRGQPAPARAWPCPTSAARRRPAAAAAWTATQSADADAGASMDLPGGSIELPLVQHGMSNALLVGGRHTTTGKPITVFGPQTGYFTPQLLTEQVLVGPGIKARGVSFAGTNLIVQLGRGEDYAWSATSASNDLVDTVVERLCNVDGSKPTVESEGYLRNGTCTPMERFEHTETTLPGAGSQEPPATHTFLVLRTHHGLVQKRTTVDGAPVALVHQRATYGHEVDSAVGFARLNDPGFVHDADSFQQAVSAIDYTFNWFYADDRDISYFSSGLLPKRAKGVDYDLPRWGDAAYDWRGWLPFKRHPRETNPEHGYLVSWNNKTAPGFAAADDVWGYGSVYRSLALEDGLKREVRGGAKVDVAGGHRGDGGGRHRGLAGALHAAVAAEGDRQGSRHQAGPQGARPRGWRPVRSAWTATATGTTRTSRRSRCSTSGGRAARSPSRTTCSRTGSARSGPGGCPSSSTTTRGSASGRPGTRSPGTATSTRTSARCSAGAPPTPTPGPTAAGAC